MKKFFQAIGRFFHNVFNGAKKFEQFLEDHVDDAIAIGSKIKDLISNPVFSGIIDLLPARWQNAAADEQQKIIDIMEKAVDKLNLSADCLQKKTFEEKFLCFLQVLKQRSEIDANGSIQKFVTAMVMSNPVKELPEHLADTIVLNRLTDQKNSEAVAEANHEGNDHSDEETA